MNFWLIFVRVFPWQPLTALKALWWHATGRRLRARNRLRAAGAALPFAYDFWMRNVERAHNGAQPSAASPDTWSWQPTFSVIVAVCPDECAEGVARTIATIDSQSYPHWTILVLGPYEAKRLVGGQGNGPATIKVDSWELALREASGEFVVPIRAGDELPRSALLRYAETLQMEPAASIIFGDHDRLDSAGKRTNPWFKPKWNHEQSLAQDYLSRAVAIRTELARDAPRGIPLNSDAPVYDLLLNVVENSNGAIVHVPHITAHLRGATTPSESAAHLEVVSRHVAPLGATASPGPFDTVKVTWPLPAVLPMVSIIVPTRDKVGLLGACVESLLARTSYNRYEVLIVDNGSVERSTAEYLARIATNPRVSVLSFPHAYNYSAINNFAAAQAGGSYLCLLNNDTEVVDEAWLTEMVRYAVRPEIGAVGAKLLYADGSIQHAGVVIGIGDGAGHAHRNLPTTDLGYFCQAHVSHYVSAVTGACLLVEKRKFIRVGGLDEAGLAIAYNDVDLCLKLEQAGWRNVYVPHAVLIHHESKSRAKDHSPSQIHRYRRELELFQRRWSAKTYDDPLLNPNLDRSSETFVIRL